MWIEKFIRNSADKLEGKRWFEGQKDKRGQHKNRFSAEGLFNDIVSTYGT
jgi:hypothetical protein